MNNTQNISLEIYSRSETIELFESGLSVWLDVIEKLNHSGRFPYFDFSGYEFINFSFKKYFGSNEHRIAGASFEECRFFNADFSGCILGVEKYRDREFSVFDFSKSIFTGEKTSFNGLKCYANYLKFDDAQFSTGQFIFRSMDLKSTLLTFMGAEFGTENEWLVRLDFTLSRIQSISFYDFESKKVVMFVETLSFRDCKFYSSFVLDGLEISCEELDVSGVEFGEQEKSIQWVSLENCIILAKNYFDFSPHLIHASVVSFENTEITTGSFNFSNITRLSGFVELSGVAIYSSKILNDTLNEDVSDMEVVEFCRNNFVDCSISFSNARIHAAFAFHSNKLSNCFLDFDRFKVHEDFVFKHNSFKSSHVGFKDFNCVGERAVVEVPGSETIVDFSGGNFGADLILQGTSIGHSISFDGRYFTCPPDLRRTNIQGHVTFTGMEIDYDFKKSDDPEVEDRYRRLKELAHDNRDRVNEINFLEAELSIHANRSKSSVEKCYVWLYRHLSDFGRSVALPLSWAAGMCALYGSLFTLYGVVFGQKNWSVPEPAFRLSLASILPTFGYNRTEIIKLKETIFGEHHGILFDILVYSESALGILFLFLIGLALRNRFRI